MIKLLIVGILLVQSLLIKAQDIQPADLNYIVDKTTKESEKLMIKRGLKLARNINVPNSNAKMVVFSYDIEGKQNLIIITEIPGTKNSVNYVFHDVDMYNWWLKTIKENKPFHFTPIIKTADTNYDTYFIKSYAYLLGTHPNSPVGTAKYCVLAMQSEAFKKRFLDTK